ncbi:MAG: MIP family channel protein [Sulfurovum sp.]|nr:MIP family channel protein [Sulfurovum sp.]
MKQYWAELVGTYILVFAGCGAIIVESLTGTLGNIGIALVFGFVVSAVIYTLGHISGAHINPAVTISFALNKELGTQDAGYYILFQVIGGILAVATLSLLFLEEHQSIQELAYYGSTIPRGSWYQSFIFEVILTFILMLVIYGSAIHSKAIKSFAGLTIGLTVGLEAMFAGPITGASMNPARSIAPALISGNISDLWIYIVAPVIGAVLAGIFYTKVIK